VRPGGRVVVNAGREQYCPRCGVAYEPTQEYCLECGARLPTNRGVVGVLAGAWQRHLAWYPGDWVWPVLFLLVLTVAATSVALAANAARRHAAPTLAATEPSVPVGPGATQGTVPVTASPATLPTPTNEPTITTGPLPTAPGSGTATGATPTTPSNPNALTVWPAGTSGYTVVLESLPASNGRAAALARARKAKANGLKDVGVLVSAQYSSLHAGYFVVFAGVYGSAAAASAAVATAHAHGFPDAFERQVTR
jgi:hypothetical protein